MSQSGALSGITVLDLSRMLPGPYASMIMADHGARVICIEDQRFEPEAIRQNTMNRGKEHMTLNLKSEHGKRIFFQLVRLADVVLEGFRPGTVSRLGVDYDAVKSVNPKIIYCSITGYGQSGPCSDKVGHDVNYLSLAGVIDLIGEAGAPPVIPGIQIADLAAGGMNAVIGVMLALYSRANTGKGQYIDISMADGSLSLLTLALSLQQATGEPMRRGETFLSHKYAFYNIYETADRRYISIGAMEKQFWKNLCEYFEVPEYISLQYDETRREEIIRFFKQVFRSRPLSYWKNSLQNLGICWAPVQTLSEALVDPCFTQRQMVVELSGEKGSRSLTALGAPIKLSSTPPEVKRMPPEFGEDTRRILKELGYEDNTINQLAKIDVI